ncbi:MAG: DUF805 domain-containing protein [Caulobacterales bacterium]|nr:DUF805 domain-containing protein [Caulobacterales bacterium]
MRGQILTFDAETGGGLISGDDGNRYAFSALDVRGNVPAVGSTVDFVAADGYAREVFGLVQAPVATTTQPAPVDYTGEDLSLWAYFVRAITQGYADGKGRARRKEFWGFTLFANLFVIVPVAALATVAASIDPTLESETSAALFGVGFLIFSLTILAVIIPSVALYSRRLHDVGMSGWLYLLAFVPFGNIFLLVVSFMPSQQQTNQYGPIPTPRPPWAT